MGRHNYQSFAGGYGIKCSHCGSIIMAEQGFSCRSDLPALAARRNSEDGACPPPRGTRQAFGYESVPMKWADQDNVERK